MSSAGAHVQGDRYELHPFAGAATKPQVSAATLLSVTAKWRHHVLCAVWNRAVGNEGFSTVYATLGRGKYFGELNFHGAATHSVGACCG